VVGFKPSHNRVSRAGVKSLSETLDTIGGFGRSVRDVALLGAVLTGDKRLVDPRNFDAQASSAPRIGLCATPDWSLADEDTQQAWAQAEKALTGYARPVALPAELQDLVAQQKAVQMFETARSLRHEHRHHAHQLSPSLLALLEDGMRISGETHAFNLKAVAHHRHVVPRSRCVAGSQRVRRGASWTRDNG
jgi:Asp-tRNA(Asn)/Glu-tRNA(Gln) amidotransferase A subunit family amidase